VVGWPGAAVCSWIRRLRLVGLAVSVPRCMMTACYQQRSGAGHSSSAQRNPVPRGDNKLGRQVSRWAAVRMQRFPYVIIMGCFGSPRRS
jgi:hypothetical protein